METRHASESLCALSADGPMEFESGMMNGSAREPVRAGADRAPDASGIVSRLERQLGRERFARSFEGGVRLRMRDGAVEVAAPSKAVSGQLERRFGDTIRRAAAEELGDAFTPDLVRFVVDGGDAQPSRAGARKSDAKPAARVASTPPPAQTPVERYRLESFIVGEANRLAYNAAARMAEGTDPAFRHLFLHGACGVGKTHLLHGVAQRFRERHPGAVIRITSGEQFVSEFIGAVRAGGPSSNGRAHPAPGNVERFRRLYRRVDLLCIDDVHFLASKQATQEELLHTFDQIERTGARVVLASDQYPRQLHKFSAALVSRFMSGLVVALNPPDSELRGKIAGAFARARGMELDGSAIALLVERTGALPGASPASVRDIEGIITRLDALHRLRPDFGVGPDGRLTGAAIERSLGHGGDAELEAFAAPVRPVRMDEIIRQTCTALSVEAPDLAGKTRHERVVLARAIITHLARALTTLSFPEIARAIGRPNHSTVITAFQRLARQIAADEPVHLPGANEARSLGTLLRQLTQALQTQAARR